MDENDNILTSHSSVTIEETLYPFGKPLEENDSVTASISYDGHVIEIETKLNGKKWVTRITKDQKDPLSLDHKSAMYLAERPRDIEIVRWLKQKFGFATQNADLVLSNIREEMDSKRQLIDNLIPIRNEESCEIIVPGYEKYMLYFTTEKGDIVPDVDVIAEAITEKFHIISYDEVIWVYKDGIYVKGEKQTREEIVKIFKRIGYNGPIRNRANDILYCIINNHHVESNPFNRYAGIPLANGVLEIDFEIGEEKLIDYSPDQKFSYKIPVKYNRWTPTEPVYKLLRSWVAEKDIETLIQIPAQALLQKMFRVTYKKFYLLSGGRDAGKSAYLTFVLKTLSVIEENNDFGFTKNDSSVSLNKLTKDKFATASLVDKIINIHNDMPQFYLTDTGDLKELIGSVHDHNVEKKFKDQTNASITAVNVFACNQLPFVAKKVRQDDDFWPKMEYIYFPYHHKKIDNWEEKNLTEANCSAFLSLILDMMKRIRQQHSLVVNTPGEVTLSKFMEDSQPLMRFIKLNMERTSEIVQYEKVPFMLAYMDYCRDKDIDEMEELISQDPDNLQSAIKRMDYTNETMEFVVKRAINNQLISFSKKLYATKGFVDIHTTVNGVEKHVYTGSVELGGSWKFKESSKYKIEPL